MFHYMAVDDAVLSRGKVKRSSSPLTPLTFVYARKPSSNMSASPFLSVCILCCLACLCHVCLLCCIACLCHVCLLFCIACLCHVCLLCCLACLCHVCLLCCLACLSHVSLLCCFATVVTRFFACARFIRLRGRTPGVKRSLNRFLPASVTRRLAAIVML